MDSNRQIDYESKLQTNGAALSTLPDSFLTPPWVPTALDRDLLSLPVTGGYSLGTEGLVPSCLLGPRL